MPVSIVVDGVANGTVLSPSALLGAAVIVVAFALLVAPRGVWRAVRAWQHDMQPDHPHLPASVLSPLAGKASQL